MTEIHFFDKRGPFVDQITQVKREDGVPILKCSIDIGNSVVIDAFALKDHIFIQDAVEGSYGWHMWGWKIEEVDPFIKIETIGNAFHREISVERTERPLYPYGSFGAASYGNKIQETVIDSYDQSYDSNHNLHGGIPYNYLQIKVTANDGFEKAGHLKFKRPNTGIVDVEKARGSELSVSLNFFGKELNWIIDLYSKSNDYYRRSPWETINNLLRNYTVVPDKRALWKYFFDYIKMGEKSVPLKSVQALEYSKKIQPNLSQLSRDDNVLYKFFLWLHNDRVRNGISNNQCIAAFLKRSGENYDELKAELSKVMAQASNMAAIVDSDWHNPERTIYNRNICMLFDAAKEKDEEKRANKEWYLKKTQGEQAIVLGVDEKKHPLLYDAIMEGEIPLSVFHDPGDKLKLVNVEFDIWEKALNRDGWADVIYTIAKNASRRSTYEKDITPYLAFLFKIEKYLDKHAPGKHGWKAMPAYVNSEWQLEMDEANEEGTVKKRSALTPVAFNDKLIVTVPYAAIAIHGRQTTYCYAKHYFVFEEFMVDDESSSVVMHDLEEKLNGRDDYGLMYYTLTGTHRNRGYPTFLVIFERLKNKTRVHFHRVHPNRYKDGRATPACKLIEECYRYMAGNIRAEEIYRQQGDLIFIKSEEPKHEPEELVKVKDFESHEFRHSKKDCYIKLVQNKAKSVSNRLGYIYADDKFEIYHPEHELIKNIPPGWYEVRRCKSWEANPKAVWSLTID